MKGARYVRRGSLGHMALSFIEEGGGLVSRAAVVDAIAPFTKSRAYADEVVTNLLMQGFVRTGLVEITEAGKAALSRVTRPSSSTEA